MSLLEWYLRLLSIFIFPLVMWMLYSSWDKRMKLAVFINLAAVLGAVAGILLL